MEQFVVGKILNNRHEIIDLIDRGGMSFIYEAMDKELKKVVVLKVLNPQVHNYESNLKRYKNEFYILSKLNNEHIISVFDHFYDENFYCLVMEKLTGYNLKEIILNRVYLHEAELENIMFQCTNILVYIHKEHIIHRDLKPENFFVTYTGQVKLLDFGISLYLKEINFQKSFKTRRQDIIGTTKYIAPEMVYAQKSFAQSDLYSLGIIFYELMVGSTPFNDDSSKMLAYFHISQLPIPVNLQNTEISKEISYVINKLIYKNPNNRFKSAKQLLNELNKIFANKPIIMKKYKANQTI